MSDPFCIEGNICLVPTLHNNLEFAQVAHQALESFQPDCIAVELPEPHQELFLAAAARLPDLSVAIVEQKQETLYTMCEPCDALFEALRSAQEKQLPAYCVDLAVAGYGAHKELLPDPYAVKRIGLEAYWQAVNNHLPEQPLDRERELYIARRLKELSLSYDRLLFVGGIAHIRRIQGYLQLDHFPEITHTEATDHRLVTMTEESAREVMAEYGWLSIHYEEAREQGTVASLDRQQLLLKLYKAAGRDYKDEYRIDFPSYNIRNSMKYGRNLALHSARLTPTLYQLLTAAKGCGGHNWARLVWLRATAYPYRKNIDNLPEESLTAEQIWGNSKVLRFHLIASSAKKFAPKRRDKGKTHYRFSPVSPFGICSYPPEDVVIEQFSTFLQKKGALIVREAAAKTLPFTSSLEDGLDTRETIRHWATRQLYVKVTGKPPGGVGSVVIIFDSDLKDERYPWRTTWLGEHNQESDMALYATLIGDNLVGPGISRCTYGGMMMSFPPRRLRDVWTDSDYFHCQNKPEVLLAAAVDYAPKPVVVYVAEQPPPERQKRYAALYGKKIAYIPIGSLSPTTLSRLQRFHVLDSHIRRNSADEYIE